LNSILIKPRRAVPCGRHSGSCDPMADHGAPAKGWPARARILKNCSSFHVGVKGNFVVWLRGPCFNSVWSWRPWCMVKRWSGRNGDWIWDVDQEGIPALDVRRVERHW